MLKKSVGRKPKRGRRGVRFAIGRISSGFKPKDPCYGPLKQEGQAKAAEAHSMFNLDLLDGKLRCECGQSVSATVDTATGTFLVKPRPHERYKDPPPRALKRDYGKRA